MKLLIIGGTEFVGRAVVEGAVSRGHEVTVFHRGSREPKDMPAVEHLHGDRDGGLDVLRGREWDASLDTCGYVPRLVRESAELLASSVGHYGFVSSLSALSDDAPAGANETTPTHRPPFPDTEVIDNDTYGPLKVACEKEALAAFPDRCLIVRPGYIVGPYDPTDRFTYWVRRAAAGGDMVAPGPDDGALQVIDVRDLGTFMLDHLEARTADVFGVIGPAQPLDWGSFVDTACAVTGSGTTPSWVAREFLEEQLGDDLDEALPLRDYAYANLHRYDGSKAIEAGLGHRPLEETIGDTLAWDHGRGSLKVGLSADRGGQLLAAWGSARAG